MFGSLEREATKSFPSILALLGVTCSRDLAQTYSAIFYLQRNIVIGFRPASLRIYIALHASYPLIPLSESLQAVLLQMPKDFVTLLKILLKGMILAVDHFCHLKEERLSLVDEENGRGRVFLCYEIRDAPEGHRASLAPALQYPLQALERVQSSHGDLRDSF